jgi:hypothetical protein
MGRSSRLLLEPGPLILRDPLVFPADEAIDRHDADAALVSCRVDQGNLAAPRIADHDRILYVERVYDGLDIAAEGRVRVVLRSPLLSSHA